jgi:hypothetical protein
MLRKLGIELWYFDRMSLSNLNLLLWELVNEGMPKTATP